MAQVVCCATLEVKFRKRRGTCKILNDSSIQVSMIDEYLNQIMRRPNFGMFLSVKMINIHTRPLHSINSDDSDVTDVTDVTDVDVEEEEDAVYTDVDDSGADPDNRRVEIIG